MNSKEKGYSLSVLVITIAVMLILTTTAIVSMKNLTKDKEMSKFMADLQEVEEFVKEYYSRKKVLPVVYVNNVPKEVELTEFMQKQVDSSDVGEYYEVDLDKLGNINLNDRERGYLVNEGSLKIYVLNSITYEGIKYYTLTDELLGKGNVYGTADAFKIEITGNPVTWVSSAELLVSIPDVEDVNEDWTFMYCKNGPINASEFKDNGTFFEYGEPIEIDENGIYSIYVENEDGISKVVNVIVKMIDDINPYVAYGSDRDSVVVGDDETRNTKNNV